MVTPNYKLEHKWMQKQKNMHSTGHINDKRYPIDSSKLRNLGWEEKISWNDGLQQTIEWYIQNQHHWENIDTCLKPHPERNE